jgi:hypothetical protein
MNTQLRQQKRFQEKNEETINRLVESYMATFTDPSKTEEEIDLHAKFLVNKWKTYCHLMKLNREGFMLLEKVIDGVKTSYHKQVNGQLEVPAETESEFKG